MKIKDKFTSTPVRQAFFNLLSGNAVVFVAHLVTLYVILQMYPKEALSKYTLFVALVYLSTKLVNLRLPDCLIREPDLEIVNKNTKHIYTLTILMTAICSLAYGLMIVFGIDFQLFGEEDRSIIFILFVASLLTNSINQLYATLLLKKDMTRQVSVGKIIKVTCQLLMTIILMYTVNYGLILALFVGTFIELIYYIIWLRPPLMGLSRVQDVITMIKSNSDIILYTLPISLLISIHDNLIVQSIEYFYGASMLAIFAVADRVLRIPSQIIGGAANMTLFKYGSDTYHKSPSIYYDQFRRGVGRMLIFFIISSICCVGLATPVFTYIFKQDWFPSAELLIQYGWWIIPFSMISILRSVPVMLREQKNYFLIELLMVISLGIGLWYVGSNGDFESFLSIKYGIEFGFFTLMICVIYYQVKAKTQAIRKLT